jgi:hypothetical protein
MDYIFVGLVCLLLLLSVVCYILNSSDKVSTADLTTVYESDIIPKTIWLYWDTALHEAPKIVQICVSLIQKLNPSFTCHVLNQRTYRNYVRDERISRILGGDIAQNYKSDLLRWYLMYEYGGIYLDASVLPFRSFEWVIDAIQKSGKELCLYKNNDHTSNPREPVYESWFIASSPKNRISGIMFQEFASLLEMGVEAGYRTLRETNTDYQHFASHGSYHLVYFAMMYLFSKHNLHSEIHGLGCDVNSYPCKFLNGYIVGAAPYHEVFEDIMTTEECQHFAVKHKFVKLTSYNREYLKKNDYPKRGTMLDYLLSK